jgi:hypothetical protein
MEEYKKMLKEIEKKLKLYGFSRKGESFYCTINNNTGVINFQKSRDTSDIVKFTINLGICSNAIKLLLEPDSNNSTTISECHWKERIGMLLPNKVDFWWELYPHDFFKINSMIEEVLIKKAIPKIEELIKDESLEEYWLNGNYGGLTELERFINLTTLLKLHNRKNLHDVIEQMKQFSSGKSSMISVRVHLKQLGLPME